MTKNEVRTHSFPTASLLDMLEAEAPVTGGLEPTESKDIARTSCRIPRAVLEEVSILAQANRMSVSLLINLLLDDYLAGQGRQGYVTLAPWYSSYVLRKKSDPET